MNQASVAPHHGYLEHPATGRGCQTTADQPSAASESPDPRSSGGRSARRSGKRTDRYPLAGPVITAPSVAYAVAVRNSDATVLRREPQRAALARAGCCLLAMLIVVQPRLRDLDSRDAGNPPPSVYSGLQCNAACDPLRAMFEDELARSRGARRHRDHVRWPIAREWRCCAGVPPSEREVFFHDV
jgi:hypothetical protein